MNLIIALLASLTTATAAFAGDLRINVQQFDASGTWKKPCGAFRVEAWVIGGGGGGISSAELASGGGQSGAHGMHNCVTILTPASPPATNGGDGQLPMFFLSGTAGAGGGADATAPGNGGHGAGYGGAGGGGGASRNGSPSGAGGNGAPGRVVIITYARNE